MKILKSLLLFFIIILVSACTSNNTTLNNNYNTLRNKPKLCNQKVVGKGICDGYYGGYEYDSMTNKCVNKGVSGCEYKTPFKTMEECQRICE